MKDYLASIVRLQKDAADAALIRDQATDDAKREMFERLCRHFNQLADEIEQAVGSRPELTSGLAIDGQAEDGETKMPEQKKEDRDVGPIAGRATAVAPNTEKNKDDASPGAAADEQAASRDR